MSKTASDGYEYENTAQRILGAPPENFRNGHVVALRFRRLDEGYIRAWYEGWDSCPADAPRSRRWATASAAAAAWAAEHPESNCVRGNGVAGVVPAPAPGVHPADQPPVPGRVGP